MTTELIASLPKDPTTGLILPLSKSLGSQKLAKHRAMVGVELEVMAKKMDRFGWERDRGSMAHDRIVSDWMDVLQDFPLSEVQAACRAWVEDNPRRMPNEGDIKRKILTARKSKTVPVSLMQDDDKLERVGLDRMNEIMEEIGFNPKRFGGKG